MGIAIARAGVEAHLAACAIIKSPIRSVYRWKGKIEEGIEVPLLLKFVAEHFNAIAALVTEHHADNVPAILAMPVDRTTDAFCAQLRNETGG